MNTKLALVLALVFGFIAAIAVKSWLTEEKNRQAEIVEEVGILAAIKRLPKGSVLKTSDCKQLPIAKAGVTAGMIPYAERLRFADRVVNREIDSGAPIFEDFLENVNKAASLARTAVQPDRRAVTLQVDQVSGVAGLIRPGDYVDVIGTFIDERPATARNVAAERITKTIYLLQAGRVLAIDSKVVSADVQTEGRSGSRISYRTVTLEVRPEDALRLISAEHAGKLQLLLRNPGEANLINGIQEIRENGTITRQKPTEYWNIAEEVFGTTANR